jgi:release factor glutamine methyltransferase
MATAPDNTIQATLVTALEALAPVHESARLDAVVLLAHVLGRSCAHLYAWPQAPLAHADLERYRALVCRRARGEPVAHLTGRREFWSMDLEVGPATLIPRPETEHLVETALAGIPPGARWCVADLGTGCGAVALAIARERPACHIVGTDRCTAALAVAVRNATRLATDNVSWTCGDWCEPLGARRFQVIVSNPPYVAAGDPHLTRGDLRFEPCAALLGGADGLAAIRRIARDARARLIPGGRLALEHGPDQGPQVRCLLEGFGYDAVRTHCDLAGHERVTEARVPPR